MVILKKYLYFTNLHMIQSFGCRIGGGGGGSVGLVTDLVDLLESKELFS